MKWSTTSSDNWCNVRFVRQNNVNVVTEWQSEIFSDSLQEGVLKKDMNIFCWSFMCFYCFFLLLNSICLEYIMNFVDM